MRTLVAIPVYNEEAYVPRVLAHVLEYADDVLVIDDGSTDRTPGLLARFPVEVIRHARNRGYGRSLRDAFAFADQHGYDWVITMDCDEQHEPAAIPAFVAAARENRADLVSGSRYLASLDADTTPPADRRLINHTITEEINQRLARSLGLDLTDAFCGFKAHRVSALRRMTLTEDGYAFPMQLWVQAAAFGLRVIETPVKLIYKDLSRSFGAALDDPRTRLAHYRQVLHCELERHAHLLPPAALADVNASCGCSER
jgi:glycosyltransferase involved in cell wall biosynthesis